MGPNNTVINIYQVNETWLHKTDVELIYTYTHRWSDLKEGVCDS